MAFVDPTYGANPIDLDLRWYQLIRPPLANDVETNAWRAVYTAAGQEILDSSWQVRWRCKSVSTALGVHLDALGSDYLLRPDGWSDDRYRSAVVAIDGVAGAYRTPARTAALADGLEQAGQAWEMMQAAPAAYVVIFYAITADEALTYRDVMEWGRPKGVGFFMVYSTVAKADTFVLDVSLLDGPDLLAEII